MIVPGWGWRGERPAWEPCRWGAPASTPWGYQRWDLGLSTSPYQINQPHTCDHTCMHVDTVYVHPHGPRACTHTHTHTHELIGTHRTHGYTWAHTCSHMSTDIHTHVHTGTAHSYAGACRQKHPCVHLRHTQLLIQTHSGTRSDHTHASTSALTYTGTDLCCSDAALERLDRGQQCQAPVDSGGGGGRHPVSAFPSGTTGE